MASFFKVGNRLINADRVHQIEVKEDSLDLVLIGGDTVKATGQEATAILSSVANPPAQSPVTAARDTSVPAAMAGKG